MKIVSTITVALTGVAMMLPPLAAAQSTPAAMVDRLYQLDCGAATSPDLSQWSPGSNQGRPIVMSNHCYLIRHGADWMLWDTGVDDRLHGMPRGKEVAHKVRGIAGPGVIEQLRRIGIGPQQVTIIAFSHAHFDHVGNSRLFPKARWYVQRPEYGAMFGPMARSYGFIPGLYAGMRRNQAVLLDGNHDVFGDGSVRIISTPGHTPGHQSLLVSLPGREPVILSGDAAHLVENFERRRVPAFNADAAETKRSMDRLATVMREEGAELWVNHDHGQTKVLPRPPAPIN